MIQGPSQIAASEVIAARYFTNAGQSIPNATTTLVNFDSRSYDTHGAVTTGAGVWNFRAPASGIYELNATCSYAGNFTSSSLIVIHKNGTYFSGAFEQPGTAAAACRIVDTIELLAGETIDVRIRQGSGSAQSLWTSPGYNYVSIRRLGGVM
jgi:hypothetical protein